ncbi:MAG: hypothetical protein IPM12_12875 [Flavobacteriales bacterium]|nr:hypothetical protein [Flavobacteriales bacterium]
MLAVPGAIAAFWVLFQRDKEKSEAVRQLARQTEELAKQTAHFAQRELHRKNAIKPYFDYRTEARMNEEHWMLEVVNKGGLAHSIRPLNESNGMMVQCDTLVQRGEKLRVRVLNMVGPLPRSHSFTLTYLDEDGNRYWQGFDAMVDGIWPHPPTDTEPSEKQNTRTDENTD